MGLPRLAVVAATYNRADSAERLLRDLSQQTLPADEFEVVVVDDGSHADVAARLRSADWPFALKAFRQDNAGPAVARHRGILAADAPVVVVLDDDMQVAAGFLEAHAALHAPGARRVVLGHIRPDPDLARLPVFERMHAAMLERWVAELRTGRARPEGSRVCTGNVSFRRDDYLAVGGFDLALDRSEDADLGVRLEQAGAELVFSEQAYTVHRSDHGSVAVWMRRAYRYGICDLRIGRKHPEVDCADPWRLYFAVNPLARPAMLLSLYAPWTAALAARFAMGTALLLDRLGLERPALLATSAVYAVEYFRGARAEAGSLAAALDGLRRRRARLAAPSGGA